MSRIRRVFMVLTLGSFLTAGCGSDTARPPDGGPTCEDEWDCQEGYRCQDGRCEERPKCTDFDGDGYCDRREGYDDCNDNRADIHPGAPEKCDGIDNDCDDLVDEDCPCNPGDKQACGTDVGDCVKGEQHCEDGRWGECQGGRQPAESEDCSDDLDNDCNGAVNDGCPCGQGDSRACGSALGECTPGAQDCDEDGLWSNCQGGTPPLDEICDDGLDNDCDGAVDDGCPCTGTDRPCGLNVGICYAGTQECVDGTWRECVGARMPEDEICDGLDNDCDQQTDEGCECLDGLFEACGTDVGECSMGSKFCIRGRWGPCEGEVPSIAELCDGRDNDCDGEYDEDFLDLLQPCAAGVGICVRPGAIVCSPDDMSTYCNAVAGSGTVEFCNGLDDDCDGRTDEDFAGLGDSCSIGLGECYSTGITTCDLGGGYQCNAPVINPQPELCDGLDNNCDGQDDETFPLGMQCSDGVGECYTQGVYVCSADGTEALCTADPPSGSPEQCDGDDDDCNGHIDDGWSLACSSACGDGFRFCINGQQGPCTAPQPQPEICDGFDNNCNNSTDEGFALGNNCQAGTGLCLSLGYTVCNADGSGTMCNAVAGTPQDEGYSDGWTTEDGVDNDCDGVTDEDW